MELERYFEHLGEDDIRLKKMRVGIETIFAGYDKGSSICLIRELEYRLYDTYQSLHCR